MKISRLFCQRFLSAAILPAPEMAAALTARGLEVDAVTAVASASGIIVGEITACAAHPNADRLQLCTVDIGAAAPLQLVCGAPNVCAGLRVAVAAAGAASIGGSPMIARTIRGVESAGMICSSDELGVGEDKDGILELTAGDGEVGSALDETLLLNDHVLEVNVTPNRGDCLSHLGIARELAAVMGCATVLPELPVQSDNDEAFPVQIDQAALAACPYYGCVVVREVDCACPLPWQWRTLIARCGSRPVSAVVDITNYLMLAYGQPLHAFDLDKLQAGIRVRSAAAAEKLVLLDGSEVACAADTLLIADAAGAALALAGVMGGGACGISAATKNILLEAAHFTPAAVAGRARQFKLNSEAAFRFERGVDFQLPPLALAQAAAHVRRACGGKVGKLVAAAGAAPPPAAPIRLPAARIGKLLGIALPPAEAVRLLNSIALPAQLHAAEAAIEVQVPAWRFDLKIAEDVIEEVVRLHGYDNLPETLPAGMRPLHWQTAAPTLAAVARSFFAAHGFYEIISYAFVPPAWEQALSLLPAQPLANPMSEEMSVMRTTLWGGLLDNARFNLRRRQERICLFEIGRCFLPPAPAAALPAQPLMVAGLMQGQRAPAQWAAASRPVDFYDVKGVLEMFLRRRAPVFKPPAAAQPGLHPGKAAEIFIDGKWVGALGELHPENPLGKDFKTPPLLFALDLQALAASDEQQANGTRQAAGVSRLPPLWRDLALVADSELPAGELLAAARALAPAPPVQEVQLFDFYAGDGVHLPRGKKSCGLRFLLQGQQATLTGEEIEQTMAAVLAALKKRYRIELRD